MFEGDVRLTEARNEIRDLLCDVSPDGEWCEAEVDAIARWHLERVAELTERIREQIAHPAAHRDEKS